MRRLQRSYDARNAKFGRAGEELQGGGEGGGFGRFQNMQFCHFFLIAFQKYETKSGSLCGRSFHMMPLTFDQVCTA